jgi:hypothetical protein
VDRSQQFGQAQATTTMSSLGEIQKCVFAAPPQPYSPTRPPGSNLLVATRTAKPRPL